MNNEYSLEISELTVNYDKTPVLWDIHLSVPKGKLTGIIGPNGAGKSTLLKACLGLVPSLSGKISIFGNESGKNCGKIAYVPQKDAVDWNFPMTVHELVLMGRYKKLGLFKRPRKADREAALLTMERLGIRHLAKRQINELSGGQKQRAFLARALLQDTDAYFLDEPFSGIDIATETVIIQILKKIVREGKSVFVVHHDLTTVQKYFDWLILLNLRLIEAGPIEKVFHKEALQDTFGQNEALFSEVLQIAKHHSEGKTINESL